jgi:hypothetical protein
MISIPAAPSGDKRGYGSAVSLPRLIVGTRHCRVLISGNINSDTTGIDMRVRLYARFEYCLLSPLKIGSEASPFRGKSNKMIHCSNPLLSTAMGSCHRSQVNCQLMNRPDTYPIYQNSSIRRDIRSASCQFRSHQVASLSF